MRHLTIAWVALCAAAGATFAETHPTDVPALASRPGAAYTIYLDFAGFSFTGVWMGRASPGVTPAYDNAVGGFTAQEQANIDAVWARVAEKYAPFDVNVTTIDPAMAAGRAGSDAERQAYYDGTARMMHTVVGGTGGWYGSPGTTGTSGVRTTQSAYPTGDNGGAGTGFHTNWVFAELAPSNLQVVGEVAAHENGHGLGESHQVDVSGSTLVNAYSTNFGAVGYGSYAPVMGSSLSSQRGTWRVGTSDKSGWAVQNDVRTIMTNTGIGDFVDDGIGHAVSAATVLPLGAGTGAVDPGAARGVIVPASVTNPTPIGVGNYVTDYFWFRTDGSGAVTLTAADGGSRLTPGVVDPGATLRSTLRIFDASMNMVGTATMASTTLSETFSGTLPAGRYFVEVASAGGYTSVKDLTAQYFDMGSYFLSGTGFSAAKWTGGASGGDWLVGANWLGGVTPQVGEDVVIPAGAAGVTHAAGNDEVRGLTNGGSLSVTGGSIRAAAFENQASGTLAVAGGVTIGGAAGSTLVNAGTVVKNGSGDAVVQPTVWNTGTVAVHGGRLVLTGGVAAGAEKSVTTTKGSVVVDAGASMTANFVRQGALVSGGSVAVRRAADGGDTSAVGTLALTGAGTLDVGDSRLVVASGGADEVRQYLRSAYDGGGWDGPGVTSSAARGDSAGRTAIGYATAGELGVSTWGGIGGLSGAEVVTRVTVYGDANLDGVINADDFALTDRGLRYHLTGWVFGDFDYSGMVDSVDYWLLDREYLLQTNAPMAAAEGLLAGREAEFGDGYVSSLIASLPEPGGVGVGIVVALGCGAGRRRGRGKEQG